MLKEFKEFISRANVIDLAVAVVIGAAFGKIVTSLVEGVIMPPIGLALGKVDFASLFLVLDHSKGVPASLADAKAKGVPIIAYGAFINEIVNFVLRARAASGGKNPAWTSYEKLREVIEKKMFSNTEDLLPVISFNTKSSEEDHIKHENFVARMVAKGYTEKQVRLLCDWYLRVRKSS